MSSIDRLRLQSRSSAAAATGEVKVPTAGTSLQPVEEPQETLESLDLVADILYAEEHAMTLLCYFHHTHHVSFYHERRLGSGAPAPSRSSASHLEKPSVAFSFTLKE